MQFEQIQALMGIGDKACRITWDAEHYIQRDADGVVRGKNKRYPQEAGSVWGVRTGYDANADDFILLTNLDVHGVQRSLQTYCGAFIVPDHHPALQYLRDKQTDCMVRTLRWDIHIAQNHYLHVHYHQAPDTSLPVTSIDIARVITNRRYPHFPK